MEKCKKNLAKTIYLKYLPRCKMINLYYLIDYILHQTFKIILSISLKEHAEKLIILEQKYK